MSYHNGSVWPHDNALIARGFANYELTDAALAVFRGPFDLSLFVDLHRIPELVCDFSRRPSEGPTLYPVACAPRSWAGPRCSCFWRAPSGDGAAPQRQIVFERALLPDFLPWVRIANLQVGAATVDLLLERRDFDVGIQVRRRSGDVQVIAIK